MLYQIYIASVMAAIFCKESVVHGHRVYKAAGHCLSVKFSMLGERIKIAMTDSCVVGHLP